MTIKIFHTADIHLGMKFANLPEVQQELIEARFGSLKKMVDTANREKCDLFVLAGDLFQKIAVAKRDIIRATQIISEFEGALAIVLPGNHDFVSSPKDEPWSTFRDNCGDTVLLLADATIYDLNTYNIDAFIYAAPCNAKHSEENRIAWIESAEPEKPDGLRIGIAHGSLEGFSPDFDKRYYPMSLSELRESGIDLWLLGHTHLQWPARPDTGDTIFYAGTPEPDGFDCSHEGTAWILTIDDNKKIIPESIQTGTYRFIEESALLNSVADIEKIRKRFNSVDMGRTLLKIKLNGRLSRNDIETLRELGMQLEKEFFYCNWNDSGITEEITEELIKKEFTEGSFPSKLLNELLRQDSPEALHMAYELIQEVRS